MKQDRASKPVPPSNGAPNESPAGWPVCVGGMGREWRSSAPYLGPAEGQEQNHYLAQLFDAVGEWDTDT